MKPAPILVRQFEVQDLDDPRFWMELNVFYFPINDTIEIRVSGSDKAVLKIDGLNVTDVHGESLGILLTDVIATTLVVLLVFKPDPHVEGSKIMQFCSSGEEIYDFAIKIFRSIKNIQLS